MRQQLTQIQPQLNLSDFSVDLSAQTFSGAIGGADLNNDGVLDSMALVNLIADVEDAVSEKFGASITLADEKAMSARNSPFLNVQTLCQAVLERIGT